MGVKLIDESLIKEISIKANESKRKRANHNFHSSYNDPIQRILNIFNPGTYIRPHKHENPDKTEIFIILYGRAAVVIFDNNGKIIDTHILDSNGPVKGIEIEPRTWHSFVVLESSALYEIKNGPWDPDTDKYFAVWAPEEESPEASDFLKRMEENIRKV